MYINDLTKIILNSGDPVSGSGVLVYTCGWK